MLAAMALFARGVGHDPESFPAVGRSAVGCADNTPSAHIPQVGQVTDDGSKVAAGNKSSHVFKQNGCRLYAANNVGGCGPHVAFVGIRELLSSDAEGLAGKACANHVCNSSVLLSCTGLCELTHVSKDRGAGQEAVCDALGNDALAVVVPFDIADVSPTEQSGAEQPAACARE
jgi:ribosomal protein L27